MKQNELSQMLTHIQNIYFYDVIYFMDLVLQPFVEISYDDKHKF